MEIQKAVKHLENEKVPRLDNIENEIIECFNEIRFRKRMNFSILLLIEGIIKEYGIITLSSQLKIRT